MFANLFLNGVFHGLIQVQPIFMEPIYKLKEKRKQITKFDMVAIMNFVMPMRRFDCNKREGAEHSVLDKFYKHYSF